MREEFRFYFEKRPIEILFPNDISAWIEGRDEFTTRGKILCHSRTQYKPRRLKEKLAQINFESLKFEVFGKVFLIFGKEEGSLKEEKKCINVINFFDKSKSDGKLPKSRGKERERERSFLHPLQLSIAPSAHPFFIEKRLREQSKFARFQI